MNLISPLRPMVDRMVITDDESYLEADTVLSRLRQARILWASKLDPIRGPIDRAMAELKLSLVGVKNLDGEVDGPLLDLEMKVKGEMRTYKLNEARRIEAARQQQEDEARQLREQAEAKKRAEETARTPQMKAKLAQARQDLETQATRVEMDTTETTAVKGASSAVRTATKIRIVDVADFLRSAQDYTPQAGIYRMAVPPLSVLTHHTGRLGDKTEEGSALEKMTAEVAKIYVTQPGVVKSWPGVEEFTDVVIASR